MADLLRKMQAEAALREEARKGSVAGKRAWDAYWATLSNHNNSGDPGDAPGPAHRPLAVPSERLILEALRHGGFVVADTYGARLAAFADAASAASWMAANLRRVDPAEESSE